MRLTPLGPIPYDGPEFPGLSAEQYGLEAPSDLLAGLTRNLMERIGQGRERNLLLVDARPVRAAGADPGRCTLVTAGGLWVLLTPSTATEFGLAREMIPFLYHFHLPTPSREVHGTRRAALAMIEEWLLARAADRKALELGFAHEEWARALHRGEPVGFPAPPEDTLAPESRVRLALTLTACLLAEPEVAADGRILPETQAALADRIANGRRDFPRSFAVAHAAAHLLQEIGLESEEGLVEAFLALLTRVPLLAPLGMEGLLKRTGIHLHFLPQARPPAAPRPGRNDPCPCGSGKKFKHCCAP
jgi:hypothetical protein